ncbi:hypothetical protein [uncultured Kordia sp.]|uniref:hypothetical protein n=1 Tax=uncultured Kordia sp. TaxID=507699 RepID=UPI002637A038|nr:hypothetical protein [uncultured Kordia sp.]
MKINIDLDSLNFVKSITGLLEKSYNKITNLQKKNKLNAIANQISRLVIHKTKYIAVLKQVVSSGEEEVDLYAINSAIAIAEKDTAKLNEMLEAYDLDASKYTFSLKHGLEKLTMLKQIKLNELKEVISNNHSTSIDLDNMIKELTSFEDKWIALGKEIDVFIEKKL